MKRDNLIDEKKVRETLSILKPDGELFEVRIIGKRNGRKVLISGYFTDVDTCIKAFDTVDLRNVNVYITLNKLKDAVYSRNQRDKFIATDNTSSDSDIESYKWLFIDLDPVRPSGVSSSFTEFNKANDLAFEVANFMSSIGFMPPVIAISGNGTHLLYKVDFEATKDNAELVKSCLQVLADKFNTDSVKIDTANFNPARICKLHGTLAQKGANTEDRPHRMSMITDAGSNAANRKDLLEELASMKDDQKVVDIPLVSEEPFDLISFLSANNITYKEKPGTDCTEYHLNECPFDGSHKNGDAKIFHYSNGAISFKCHHNSCSGRKWQDVRLLFDPFAYDQKEDTHIADGYQRHKDSKPKEEQKQKTEKKKNYKNLADMRAIDLVHKELEPLKVYVGLESDLPLLVEGTCIVSAKAKTGKSWFIQDMLIAIANGEDFLGFKTRQSSVLHMNFESGDELEQARFKKSIESAGRTIPECYYRSNQLPDKIGDGFEAMIADYMAQDPNLGVVVIDVFQMVRSSRSSLKETEYEYAYRDIAPLNELCKKYHISIILVTHDRKGTNPEDPFENILGSTGLQAAVSQMIVLYRLKKDAPLHISVKGKTIDGVHDFDVNFQNAKFELTTSNEQSADDEKEAKIEEYKNSPIREAILAILRQNGSYKGRAGGIINEAIKEGIALEDTPLNIAKFLRSFRAQALKVDNIEITDGSTHAGSLVYKIQYYTPPTQPKQLSYLTFKNAESETISYF